MTQPLSLKNNILLLNALILGTVLALLGTTFYFYEYEKRLSLIDASLDQLVTPLRGKFSRPGHDPTGKRNRPPSGPRPEPSAFYQGLEGSTWERREDGFFGSGGNKSFKEGFGERFNNVQVPLGFYAGVTRRTDGQELFRSSNFPDMEIPQGTYQGYFYRFREGDYREMLHGERRVNILIGLDLARFRSELHVLKLQILAVATVIFLLSLGFWYIFISRQLRPLKSIQDTAIKIADGELSERIDSGQEGCAREFDILIRELNHSFTQLDDSFQRQLRFTADASHELKTPLTVLKAHIELALKGSRSSEEYLRMLRICSQSSGRLNRIIQELLEISRYDAGNVQLEFETLPLDEVIRGLVEEMEAYAQERNCVIQTDLNSGSVEMDPFRIEQVLTNLINNALQHNDDPVTVTVRSRIADDQAMIEVIDNGKGIQPENIDRLFDRFFQEDDSRTQKQDSQNTGLGMAICKAIIDLHGGSIQIRSKPGVETAVVVKIPRKQSNQN
ncbi:MAG: HAMP domain-containing sensor histidine kinase [Verrucomicrobiota bacterium]